MSGSRDYPRLTVESFGHHLLTSGDLDPIYIALDRVAPERELRARWMGAYWCFYDAGAASYIAEQPTGEAYWDMMRRAAANRPERPAPHFGPWPRGRERRHFRGRAAVDAVEVLFNRYGERKPERFALFVAGEPGERQTYGEVAARAETHPMFGPWIAFKMADMCERLLGSRVDFGESSEILFKDPLAGAAMVWDRWRGLPEGSTAPSIEIGNEVIERLGEAFSYALAPPTYDRTVNLQEVETILCKIKAHWRGHYPLFNDTREIRRGIEAWTRVSPLAARFQAALPPLPSESPAPREAIGGQLCLS